MDGVNHSNHAERVDASLPLLAEMQRIQDEAHAISEEAGHRLDELFGDGRGTDGRGGTSGRG